MESANTVIEPIIIIENITLADVRAAKPRKIYYAANTCWWTHNPAHLGRKPDSGLPCDPRGSVLFETEDVEGFLQAAEAHPEHYGKHGLRAFLAAHHQNACLNGRPWSARSWDSYNAALDRLDLQKAAGEIVSMNGVFGTSCGQSAAPGPPQLSTRELIAALKAGKVSGTGALSLEMLEATEILIQYNTSFCFPIAVLLKTLRERDQELILRTSALDAAKQLNEQLRIERATLQDKLDAGRGRVAAAIDLLAWCLGPDNQRLSALGTGSPEAEQYNLGLQAMHDALVWSIEAEAFDPASKLQIRDLFESNLVRLRDHQGCVMEYLAIEKSIRWFPDSPDQGDSACVCSLCGEVIAKPKPGDSEDALVPIRLTKMKEHLEARFHPECFEKARPALGI